MYAKFKFESVELKDIALDDRNPRIVTQAKLSTQAKIVEYLFEHEDLASFIKKIVAEGKNHGAERPYVIKSGAGYTVIEGNTRIAAYKLLTGIMSVPKEYVTSVPNVTEEVKASMGTVDCSIAPGRDALLPIMANAHFGQGDKSKWGYLGSRKAVYDEWKAGKIVQKLSKAFDLSQGEIKDLILEYKLYLSALSQNWTTKEKGVLLDPKVKFNPPVRFLQAHGHGTKVGISYDRANVEVVFADAEAKRKFKHLLTKLVINPVKGLGATASYDDVFADYSTGEQGKGESGKANSGADATGKGGSTSSSGGGGSSSSKLKPWVLLNYPNTMNNGLIEQLMKEAKDINCKKFPAAATFLLRNIVEAILKHIIEDQNANKSGGSLDLEGSINLCLGNNVKLTKEEKKVLKEFKNSHLDYLNLGAHGNVIPNPDRLFSARDCIDQFVKRNV